MIERTNEEWQRLLTGSGPACDVALTDLREILRRGLHRAVAGRAGVDEALIEDLTQDALVKVLGGLSSFQGESRLTTWAITIAVRVAFTELRRARWKDVSLDQLTEDVPGWSPQAAGTNPEEQAAKQAVLAVMDQVLREELTDRQRQALVAELRGMPQVEIAAQLGLTRNALYKLTHDARQKLKRGLEAAGITADEVLKSVLTNTNWSKASTAMSSKT